MITTRHIHRLSRFVLTNSVGTFVDLLILWLLSHFVFASYTGQYLISPLISFECAVLTNFFCSWHFVWSDRVKQREEVTKQEPKQEANLPSYQEHYDAVAEKKRIEAEETLQRVLDYTMQTMVVYMSEVELNRLCGYITEYSLNDIPREVSPVSVDSAIKSIDLMHFGWNIGKAFGKKRIHTATFIKRVFAHSLRDIEVSTIERKMSHTESECRIKLDGEIV